MSNESEKKLKHFSVTMTDLLRACFSDAENYYVENTAAIDFFLYMIKYNKENDSKSQDRNTLITALASHSSQSNTPEISVLFDFLNLHLLKNNDDSIRENIYRFKSGSSFTQKPHHDLIDYCKNELGLELITVKDLTQDSVIDIITICFLIGRHGLPNQRQRLQNMISNDLKSTLDSILSEQKTKFTVIHGNINERKSRYMLKYVLHQLHNNSYSTSYDNYQLNTFPQQSLIDQTPKYANMKQALYPAICNSYLMQKEDHYFIIHSISSQNDLDTLISECKLCKNIMLICDFDIASSKNSEHISYISFQDFYAPPCLKDINHFFKRNHIEIDNLDELSQILLTVSNGNLFLLHTLELLTKHLWGKERISPDERIKLIEKLKDSLSNLSLEANSDIIPKEKFSMPGRPDKDRRSGNYLIGHIRQLYNEILSADEWLLLLLVALHGEEGLSEELLLKILSISAFNVTTSLENKGLISKRENIYYYEDSLLIPYALIYGKFSLESNGDPLFFETFSFLNFMLNEICYHNSEPIDYDILCATIKKTYKTTYRLLYKSNDTYNEYFPKIWYYHIRYTRFLFENGDINSIKELYNNFHELEKKLTLRPKEYKHWKRLYKIYLDFLEHCIQTVTNSFDSWAPFFSLLDRLMEQIKSYSAKNKDLPDYWKLCLCLLEAIISYSLRLCISGVRNGRVSQTESNTELYVGKILTLKEKSKQIIFSWRMYVDDKDFISEMETSFNNIIQLADIQCHTIRYVNELIKPQNLYEEPRYVQLSWFQKSCMLLYELCYSGRFTEASEVSDLQKTVTFIYIKLKTVPLNILEDYYYALINFTLAIVPYETEKLLDYIHEDLERYKHIWKHSETMARINDIISKIHSKIQTYIP